MKHHSKYAQKLNNRTRTGQVHVTLAHDAGGKAIGETQHLVAGHKTFSRTRRADEL